MGYICLATSEAKYLASWHLVNLPWSPTSPAETATPTTCGIEVPAELRAPEPHQHGKAIGHKVHEVLCDMIRPIQGISGGTGHLFCF